jgi:hypothetical protein
MSFAQALQDFATKVRAKQTAGEAAHYGSLGRYLPPELRSGVSGPLIGQGLHGIGELIRNPAGLGSNINEAIQPRLGAEMRTIGQNFSGLRSEQAGAAARGNLPVSIKGALQKALNTNQMRAEGEARGNAIMESDQLRRGDLGQTYQLLDTILQFMSSGQGQGMAGVNAANSMRSMGQQQGNAANTALIGSLLQAYGGGG